MLKGKFNLPNLTSDPTGAAGKMFFNPNTKKIRMHNGTQWDDWPPAKIILTEIFMIGGGGAGGWHNFGDGGAGGGGAGGLVLENPDPETYILEPGTNYTVTVGNGGGLSTQYYQVHNGESSVFDTYIAYGGGYGSRYQAQNPDFKDHAQNGGCGGGASYPINSPGTGSQGGNGGAQYQANNGWPGGGGGGIGGNGGNAYTLDPTWGPWSGGAGGPGLQFSTYASITGTGVNGGWYGGGGEGGCYGSLIYNGGNPGHGGGSAGGGAGVANTGGGGGACHSWIHTIGNYPHWGYYNGYMTGGGPGGSGIVVIRYPDTLPDLKTIDVSHACNFQAAGTTTAPAPITGWSGYKVYCFKSGSGSISW